MNTKLVFTLLALLFGCLPATKIAGTRRMAEHKLRTCKEYTRDRDACYADVEEYCAMNGAERGCGYGGITDMRPVWIR